MIFIDTGAWYARYVTEDVDHNAAVAWFANAPDRLITTDYVVDELLTLLKVRGYSEIAYKVGNPLVAGTACRLEYVQPRDISRSWTVFSTFHDKDWSFTDCTSYAVIERMAIKRACAFDQHFRQFGNVLVVP